jgi:hypothetical protein
VSNNQVLAAEQLSRMRGMTRYYHERFFSDIRFTTGAILALFVLGWSVAAEAFLLIPIVALLGAVTTAFDASYLIFARQYAARLERYLDPERELLVAAELETAYLFPLDTRKVVTASIGEGFSFFGFVTLFYPVIGVVASGFALALGWAVLEVAQAVWMVSYLISLGSLTVAALAVGVWWFVGGVGERRLKEVLDSRFD